MGDEGIWIDDFNPSFILEINSDTKILNYMQRDTQKN